MSELDQAYRALAQEADTVGLAAPGALRARADRRTRLRVTAVTVAAAVAVGGAIIGTQQIFRADGTGPQPIPPGVTPSATPSPPAPTASLPSSAPPDSPPATSGSTTPPPARNTPKSIPNSAFLQASDTGGEQPVNTRTEDIVPSLCGASFDSDEDSSLRRSRRITYWNDASHEGQVPDGTFRQTITVYDPDRAGRFLEEIKDAVANCPTEGEHRYRMVTAPKRGDESLMFEDRYPTEDPDGNPTGGDDVRLVSVVRVGYVVTILYETGWEAGWSAEPDVVSSFAGKAVSRIRSWLD